MAGPDPALPWTDLPGGGGEGGLGAKPENFVSL